MRYVRKESKEDDAYETTLYLFSSQKSDEEQFRRLTISLHRESLKEHIYKHTKRGCTSRDKGGFTNFIQPNTRFIL